MDTGLVASWTGGKQPLFKIFAGDMGLSGEVVVAQSGGQN